MKCILVASPGRSGTHFLSTLLSRCCPSVHSLHEPQPSLSDYHLGLSSSSLTPELITAKVKAMHETATHKSSEESGLTHYAETNHTLLHSDRNVELVQSLLDKFESIHIIIPGRPVNEVILSRLRLGHGESYMKEGALMYRGLGWIYLLNSSELPSARTTALDPFDVVSNYVNRTGTNIANLERVFSDEDRVAFRGIEWPLQEVNVTRLIGESLGLVYDRQLLKSFLAQGRTNEREGDKKKAELRAGRRWGEREVAVAMTAQSVVKRAIEQAR